MKIVTKLFVALGLLAFVCKAGAKEQIVVETGSTSLVFTVGDNGRLYQSYFGKRLTDKSEYAMLPQGKEAYMTHGMEDYFEPALHITRSDGNPSTLLKYKRHETNACDGGTETVIYLADPVYADEVAMHFVAYAKEDVFKAWTEIFNREKSAITLEKYASSMLHMYAPKYYLTQYNGDWATEAGSHTQELYFGKKVIDTKLGARADMFCQPFFQLSLGSKATEREGEVLVGTLAWTGNFRFTFEVDNLGGLRVISGINPYASQYTVAKNKSFRTPEFIFTLSQSGTGHASRNLHDWARKYQIKDGQGDRMTLLNNWEATYFDFDENKLLSLIGEAKELGVDMFLLDDGWFGNKYKRHSDTQALGDWEVTYDASAFTSSMALPMATPMPAALIIDLSLPPSPKAIVSLMSMPRCSAMRCSALPLSAPRAVTSANAGYHLAAMQWGSCGMTSFSCCSSMMGVSCSMGWLSTVSRLMSSPRSLTLSSCRNTLSTISSG